MSIADSDKEQVTRGDETGNAESRATASSNEPAHALPQIYAFVNGGSPGWYNVEALTEDGVFIAGHCCSHPGYGPHDMGVVGDWKHEHYRAYYPDGFEVVWIDDAKTDPRVQAAYARHVAMTESDYLARIAPVTAASEARAVAKAAR